MVYFLIQNDALSKEIQRAVETFTNCRLLLNSCLVDKDEIKGNAFTVFNKSSGYSLTEVF